MKRLFSMDWLLCGLVTAHAKHHYGRYLRAAHSAEQTQERVLFDKLIRNADSDYGRDHHFAKINSYRDFVERVPVQTYEHLQPYVQKTMAGHTRAMFGPGQRVLMFAMTSGSTDKPKYVPVTPAFLAEYRQGMNAFGVKALLDHPAAFLRPILQVASPIDETHTPHGVPCGSISGLIAANQSRLVKRYMVTRAETAYIADAESRYYTIMRYAVSRPVGWMITASPATQLKLARAVEHNGERFIRDIHDGTLRPPNGVPGQVLRALMVHAQPDHATARRLTALIEQHGALLPKHYWDLAFIANWTGGTMGLHLRDFQTYFGDTPVRDIGLLATEGRVSICLEDGTPAGLLDAGGCFFEFIDADADASDAGAIHRCHEVIPGQEYRVLMTNSAGFYRYDIGDHVRVHRMVGQAPVVEFLHRGAHVSSITGEKLTEWQVTTAFRRCCETLGLPTCRFVLAPVWDDPPYYRLHIDENGLAAQQLDAVLDRALAVTNTEYASKRSSQRLGPVRILVHPEGTLEKLDAQRQQRGAAANEQFKHQYLYTSPGDDDVLMASPRRSSAERVASAHGD